MTATTEPHSPGQPGLSPLRRPFSQNLDATRRLQQAMIAQSEAEVASVDAEMARSRSDVERYRRPASDQYASIQRFQQADADNRKALVVGTKPMTPAIEPHIEIASSLRSSQ